MFAPNAIRKSIFSSIKAGTWVILLLIFGTLLALKPGADAYLVIGCAATWAAGVVLGRAITKLARPENWHPTPVCRGRNPGRCALTIDVKKDEEQGAIALATYLHGRGTRATFFLDAMVVGVVPSLHALDHEIGHLSTVFSPTPEVAPARERGSKSGVPNPDPAEPLVRATNPWQNRWFTGPISTVGWSVSLTPKASTYKVTRVVGTDIVRISAVTPIATLGRWLDDWDSRAVAASTFSATFEAAR